MPEALDPVTRQHVKRAAERASQREFDGIFSQETIARYIAGVDRSTRRRSHR